MKKTILLLAVFWVSIAVNAQTYFITTVAGTGVGGATTDGVAATSTPLSTIYDICSDTVGNLYLLQAGLNGVRKIDTNGIVNLIAGSGTAGYSGNGGSALSARFSIVYNIVADKRGNIFICESLTHTIRKIDASGNVNHVAGVLNTSGFSGDGGSASTALLNTPSSLVTDDIGNLYFQDRLNYRIRKIDTFGIITTVAGNGTNIYSSDGLPATATGIDHNSSIAVDKTGNLFIACPMQMRILKVNNSGIFTTYAGDGVPHNPVGPFIMSGDDGPATNARFSLINDIATDHMGNLFIVDGSLVRMVNTSGIITRIGGMYSSPGYSFPGYSGDNGFARNAQFSMARRVEVTDSGVVYVADINTNVIRKMQFVNYPPSFVSGAFVSLATCTQGATFALDTLLAVNDADSSNVLAWTPITTPIHGTLTASITASTNSGIVIPSGLSYVADSSYTGVDSFVMDVFDGIEHDTITIRITVVSPTSGIMTSAPVCMGSTAFLMHTAPGGTWVSSDTTVASIGDTNGLLTSQSIGTTTITYNVYTGCSTVTIITVNPAVAPITGDLSLCEGESSLLSSTTSGGTWSVDMPTVASIGSGGLVTGPIDTTFSMPIREATITYTTTTGCAATATVTINALPVISGATNVCLGTSIMLSTTSYTGDWYSSNTSVATVDATGMVTGVSAGTSVITSAGYGGCNTTHIVTVNDNPVISGVSDVCQGASTLLSSSTFGGTWLTYETMYATVASSGLVTGVSPGYAGIYYTDTNGCVAFSYMTIHESIGANYGTATLCSNATTWLGNSTSYGGIWTSGNSIVATIDSFTGDVSGVSAGTAIMTYTAANSCTATTIVTVLPLPASITGNTTICTTNTSLLSSATTGGTWNSSDTLIASTPSTSGLIYGESLGTATITYTLPTGCYTTTEVTINPTVTSAITGIFSVCVGESIALSIAHTGGTWSSSTPSIATINAATGDVVGINAGTTTITYTSSASCIQTAVVTVNPLPASITGNAGICKTGSTLLSSATPGGIWTSNNPLIASTPTTSGLIYGASIGTAFIKYTLPTGCATTREVTVNPIITSAITGTFNLCQGVSTTLSILESGGTWSSSAPTIASIDASTGVVLGIGTGTSIITYRISYDCYQTAIVTTNPLPKTIGGITSICAGSSAILSSNPPGGTWSSGNTAVATIVAATGTYTGVAAGTAVISYTLPTGCFRPITVTINPSPTPITGSLQSCIGRTIAHTSSPAGGTWSSSTPAQLTIDPAGFSTGVALGTSTISYTSPSGCRATAVVTVGATPTVTGPTLVCAGNTITLVAAPLGGTWVSSNPSGASVNVVGQVTGVATGVTTIRYTAANTCFRNTNVTVNAAVNPITGSSSVCTGTSTPLSSLTAGGTWQSSSTTVASIVTATGVATGVNAGTSNITYRTGTNCFATRVLTVNPTFTVAAISGPSLVCTGNNITLTTTTTGGVWSSSATSIATISGTGIVSGIAAGTTTISYTKTNSCGTAVATRVITVNPLPNAGTITGTSPLCTTTTATFTSTITGGTWSSSYPAGATINASTGLVTGVAAGSFVISYRMTNPCGTAYATYPLTVISAPLLTAITGATSVCEAASTTLANTTSGGTWTSTNTAAATIDAATGVATGIVAGITTISYTATNACGTATTSRGLTVNPLPTAAVISGTATLPAGTTTTLTAAPLGGTWLSANGAIASINASGVVTGVAIGNATISYTRTNSCGNAVTTVIATVTAASTPITGILAVCEGATSTLANASAGGTWTTADGAIATVSSTGVVTGVAAGTTTVSYAFISGGSVTAVVTVNAAPAAYTGSGIICTGSQLNLGSIIPGCTWSSGNTARATVVSTSGIVTGGSSLGTVNISYTNAAACRTITQLTVNAGVAAITGVTSPCVGNIITLATTTLGGTWSSSVTAHATIDASTGVLTAVAGGTTTISYTVSTGCVRTTIVTVGTPPAITGNPSICFGQTSLLVSSGGVWSSSNPIVATVAASGIVTGVSLGNAVITYRSTANALCFVTQTVTVNPVPSAIVAPPALCPGQTATLTSSPAGGTWTSNFPTKASVDPVTGVVTAVIFNYTAISVVNITYTLPTGCGGIATVTVNPLPSPIGGNRNICVAGSTTLTNSTTGGTWSSANPALATAAAGGVVTGVSAGLATISYTNALGCANTEVVTVNAMPGANTGLASLCLPSGTTLSNAAGAGTWTSSNTTIATVNFSSGAVTGINSGTANITYSKAAGCTSVTVVTVNAGLPAITGTAVVCVGLNTTLTNTTSGGTWSSSDPSIATISSTGVVTGVNLGNSTITYSNGACNTTREVTVNCFARPANTDVQDVAQTSFSLFPNPTTGNLTLATSVSGKATIYTVDGKEVQSYDVAVGNNNLNLPYNLATGVYMCRFTGTDGSSQLARLVYQQ